MKGIMSKFYLPTFLSKTLILQVLTISFISFRPAEVFAQSIFSNSISGGDPSESNPYTAGQVLVDGISVSGIGYGGGLNDVGGNNRYNTLGYSTSSTLNAANNDFIYWTITPNSCSELDLSSLTIAYSQNGLGPESIALRSNIDGFSTNIWSTSGVSVTEQTVTISLAAVYFQNITSPITFRLYGWHAQHPVGSFAINSFSFNGNVVTSSPAVVGVISGQNTICSGTSASLVLSNSTGYIQWQMSSDNAVFTDIAGATSSSYNSPNLSSTTYFRAAVQSGACDEIYSESFVVSVIPFTVNTPLEPTVSCDSYIWPTNGLTYTNSGTYTSVTGCHTETLVLTITPSTNNTTTASACDSYTWSVNGTTYTTSGTYTSVTGCHTETLVLTVNTSSVYSVDADGDGFGSTTTANFCSMPATGYSLNNNDCDDAVSTTYPGAVELCNNVDDNCNGFIDEGCPSTIPGEEPFNAHSAPTTMYSYCNSFYGTLENKFPSQHAHSICETGEDVWYSFTAQTSGVTIFIGSYVNDIVIELQDANGITIDVENIVVGPGTEVLTTTALIEGNEYRFAVRNKNSELYPGGQFSACVRHLRRGGSDSGTSATWPSTLSTCSLFKAAYCGGTGVQYRYVWTGISGSANGQVFTRTQVSDYLNVTAVAPSLHAGCSYNVLVTAIYSIPNGAGVNEVVEMSALAPTTITISPVANIALRSSDQITNGPRYRGSIVAALPWVCGVTNWRWRFTEVNPLTLQAVGLPIEQNRGAASNYLNLGSVIALQYGKTYAVQSAPIFTYTGTNYQWGPVKYMSIIGSAGMTIDASQDAVASQDSEKDVLQGHSEVAAQEMELSVYPNPTHGDALFVSLSGIDSDNVQVKVYDALGRKIESKRFVVEGTLQTSLNFTSELSNGLYILEVNTEDVTRSVRFMVEQ
ncbi:MAG: putative adhesin [Bacteroidota bacterium]|jgi:hypothetical protein